jgi:hypothetical protein
MNKKIIALLTAALFTLGLSACGGGDDSSIPKQDNTSATTDGTNPKKPVATPETKPEATPAAAPAAAPKS